MSSFGTKSSQSVETGGIWSTAPASRMGYSGRGFGHARSRQQIFFLAVAGLLSIFSLAAIFAFVQGGGSEPTVVVVQKDAPVEMVDVLVPVSNINPGEPLQPQHFRVETRPSLSISPRVIKDYEEIKGRFARALILPGQPLMREQMVDTRPINQITASIPEGYRAVTIHVDARTSVEGWARAGSRVDVFWIGKLRGEQSITTLVQNALILSAERMTAQQAKEGSPVPTTVTLLVTAEDANKVNLAITSGTITMALRGSADKGHGNLVGSITMNDLLAASGLVDNKPRDVRGVAKVKGPHGTEKEWVIVNGKVVEKTEQGNL